TRPLATVPGLPPVLTTRPTGCRFAPRCGFATDLCRTAEPELSDGPDGGRPADRAAHAFACFHPAGPAPGADPVAAIRPPAPAAAPPRTDAPLLRLTGLAKSYPLHGGPFARRRGAAEISAVAGISLTVRRGETFGIVGESGCGKSTLGRLAVGLEAPTTGTVEVAGRDLATLRGRALRAHRREVQLMFQDSAAAMDPRMRVGAVLTEPLVIQGIGDRAARQRRIAGLLDDVGLPRGAVDRYPHEFSGGQRQRLGLARALALAPSLVVADEPVSALDVSVQAQILNLMRALQRDKGLSYLFISHDLAVVRHVADRVGVMYLGTLVETGPAEAVFDHPLHPYTRRLLDTVRPPDPASRPLDGETPSAAAPPSGCRFRTRCAFATHRCATEPPPPVEAAPAHSASCHFPLRLAVPPTSLYVPNTGPSGPSPPVGGGECGGWGWALGVQGVLRTPKGGSNRSRKGCEGPLRGHNRTRRRSYSRSLAPSAVHTTGPGGPSPHPTPTQPAAGATARRPAAGQTATYAAPQSATARRPAAQQTGTCGAPQSAQRRASPAAQQTGTWEAGQAQRNAECGNAVETPDSGTGAHVAHAAYVEENLSLEARRAAATASAP
ncbi:ABC transporter ATP-binding protein, partial [Streptomyces sp. NRRL S-1448]|uniref:ABC transporter ATP-binding protein n=1 Tax=Streptomyces sp. NRRL S-1448 TaxID=1463883 RepID=UPI00131B372B